MTDRTITITISESKLAMLAALARVVATEIDTATERREHGHYATLHAPESVRLDVRKMNTHDLSWAADAAENAVKYTRECEAELRQEIANILPREEREYLHTYTRPQIVASFQVHGSFGKDGEVRQAEAAAKSGLAYHRIGANRGHSGYAGRDYTITHGIFCG